MAYVNGTTHYNLPQTVGTDKRDWADTNEAFAALDAAVYSAVEDVADAQTEINGLKDRMTTAESNITTNASDISSIDGRVTTLEGTVSQHTTQIADVRQDAEDMICAYNEATATSTHAYAVGDYFIYNDVLYRATASIGIGDTIVPDTNCATTNVTTEIRGSILREVVSDGVKTRASLYSDLITGIDFNRFPHAMIVQVEGAERIIYNIEYIDSSSIRCSGIRVNIDNNALNVVYDSLSLINGVYQVSQCLSVDGTVTLKNDLSSNVPTAYAIKYEIII